MNYQIIITFTILIVSMILFLSDKIRADLVALLVALSLGITAVLTTEEAFSGFSRSAIFTLIGIFIMADGLRRTGVTERMGRFLLRIAGAQEDRLIAVVTLSGAMLSLFMNNIAAASVLLPAVIGAAQKSKISTSKLLIPLAFGTILGGTATLLTTMNIIVNSLLRDQGYKGFGLLDFAPLGIPIIFTGVLYLVILGRKSLPSESRSKRILDTQPIQTDLAGVYRLGERLTIAKVKVGSYLAGVHLNESHLREKYQINLIAVRRGEQLLIPPSPTLTFKAGDSLLLEGRPEDFSSIELQTSLEISPPQENGTLIPESSDMILVETVLSPRSGFLGKSLKSVMFRDKFGMNVLAVWRAGRPLRTRFSELPLEFGDTLLLQGPRNRLALLRSDPDLILLADKEAEEEPDQGKARLAGIIMLATLIVAASGWFSIGEVMLAGAIIMILFGILNMDQAYQSIEWKSIFLVAGMLPMGIALSKTGASALIAKQILSTFGGAAPVLILAVIYLITVLLTQAMSGAAVAAIIAPIAIDIAIRTGVDPRSFAMGVALATSMAFITPLGHPVNILVMSPGGYKFKDYLKVGLPLTALLFLLIILLLPVIWPFHPVQSSFVGS